MTMYLSMIATLVFIACMDYGNAAIGHAPRRGCPMALTWDPNICPGKVVQKNCVKDTDCPSQQGCCETDCGGMKCMELKQKAGSCGPDIFAKCITEDRVACRIDYDCEGGLICCRTPCAGSECRLSEFTNMTITAGSGLSLQSSLYSTLLLVTGWMILINNIY